MRPHLQLAPSSTMVDSVAAMPNAIKRPLPATPTLNDITTTFTLNPHHTGADTEIVNEAEIRLPVPITPSFAETNATSTRGRCIRGEPKVQPGTGNTSIFGL
jgi:hypothetical protein